MLIQCMQMDKCIDNRKLDCDKCLRFDMDCWNTSFLKRKFCFFDLVSFHENLYLSLFSNVV